MCLIKHEGPCLQGVYQIKHIPTQLPYIGASECIEARWKAHKGKLNYGNHSARKLQQLWDQDGPDAFAFEIVELIPSPFRLARREQYYLDLLERETGGHGLSGVPWSSKHEHWYNRGLYATRKRALKCVSSGKATLHELLRVTEFDLTDVEYALSYYRPSATLQRTLQSIFSGTREPSDQEKCQIARVFGVDASQISWPACG